VLPSPSYFTMKASEDPAFEPARSPSVTPTTIKSPLELLHRSFPSSLSLVPTCLTSFLVIGIEMIPVVPVVTIP
jgi:hypothetical protein